MTNVSKKELSAEHMDKLFKQFNKLFAAASENQTGMIFGALLTRSEKIMLIKRLAIVLMLDKGISMYRISETLHVSNTTVGTIYEKFERGMYDPVIKVSRRSDFNSDSFWKTIELILTAGMPPRGRGRWRGVLK